MKKKVVFIAGPLYHKTRRLLKSALSERAFVKAFGTAKEMDRKLQKEKLRPHLLILSFTNVPDDNIPLITFVEEYWKGAWVHKILIFPGEEVKQLQLYSPYNSVCFVEPVVIEDIVKKAFLMLNVKNPHDD